MGRAKQHTNMTKYGYLFERYTVYGNADGMEFGDYTRYNRDGTFAERVKNSTSEDIIKYVPFQTEHYLKLLGLYEDEFRLAEYGTEYPLTYYRHNYGDELDYKDIVKIEVWFKDTDKMPNECPRSEYSAIYPQIVNVHFTNELNMDIKDGRLWSVVYIDYNFDEDLMQLYTRKINWYVYMIDEDKLQQLGEDLEDSNFKI